jgi:hypothetical protein
MIEQVGVGPVLLIENVGEGEELLVRLEQRLLHPLQPHLRAAEILVDAEGNERGLEDVLIETVVAQRLDEFNQVLHLARIDDAETVHIPTDRIARFGDPPILVVGETNDAPVESGNSFGHGKGEGWIFAQRVSGG